jgi:hypothetical protein
MKPAGLVRGVMTFLCLGTLCAAVSAGPNHDAAIAIVHQGEAISGTGNLDAAMAEYARVEELYPEEYEAIAWAKYRTSECLVAGWRWEEAPSPKR